MALITDASNDKQLKDLDAKLLLTSYLAGYEPSSVDAATFAVFKKAPTQPVNVARWYKHIASFSADEQKKWTGGAAASSSAAAPAAAGGDDFDLFGSEDEEESAEAARIREERLAAYAEKKAKKPGPIAKSSVILDVKPWDDETDLGEMEKLVKSIEQDGLLWGATKLIPIGYGIKKLQIVSTIEDAKVSVDDLIEKIQDDFSDHVQSVDIVAFNKI